MLNSGQDSCISNVFLMITHLKINKCINCTTSGVSVKFIYARGEHFVFALHEYVYMYVTVLFIFQDDEWRLIGCNAFGRLCHTVTYMCAYIKAAKLWVQMSTHHVLV